MKTALVTKESQGGLLMYLYLSKLQDVKEFATFYFAPCIAVKYLKFQLFCNRLSPHIETSQLVYGANYLISYCIMRTLAFKWLRDIHNGMHQSCG